MRELTDDEVFGVADVELSDDEVFGAPAAPAAAAAQPEAQFVSGSRGTMRGGPRPFVAGGDNAAAVAEQARRSAAATDPRRVDRRVDSVLERPAPLQQVREGQRNAEVASRVDESLSPLGRQKRDTAVAGVDSAIASERAQKAAAEAALPGRFEGAGTAGDLLLSAGKAFPMAVGLVAGMANLPTGGAFDAVGTWADRAGQAMDKAKSTEARASARELDAILKSESASPLTVLGFLASKPEYVAGAIIESMPSLLIGAGGGRAAVGAFGVAAGRAAPAALASNKVAVMTELAAMRAKVATGGAAIGNVGMGAGSVFSDESLRGKDLIDRYNAAATTALGYAAAGRLTGGGAEAALAGSGARGALKIAGRESGQEFGESLSESFGKVVGTGEPVSLNEAAKGAVVDAVAGFGMGGAVGALQSRGQMSVEDSLIRALETGQTRAAPDIRAEDMPTRPFTLEEVDLLAATAPPAVEKIPVGEATELPGMPDDPIPVGEATEIMAPRAPAAPAGPGIGIGNVRQGALADIADQQLQSRAQGGQLDVAVPAGVAPVAGDGRAPVVGGGGGDLGPLAGGSAGGGGATAGEALAGGGKAAPSRSGDPTDPALSIAASVEPFKTSGQAMAYQVQERLAGTTQLTPTPGGFVLQPKARAATPATLKEDERELTSLNQAITKAGWETPAGAPVAITRVPDDQAPRGFGPVAAAVESAFGVRVIPVAGTPGGGVQWGRRAYVSAERASTPEMLIGLTGHESFHWLEVNDPAAAKALYTGMAAYLRPGAVAGQQRFENENLTPGEAPMTEDGARSEVMANINGAMWLDPEFWSRMYDLDNGSTFRRVAYQFMRAGSKLARIAAGGAFDARRYVTNVEAVREVAAKVWSDRAKGLSKRAQAKQRQAPVQNPPQARLPGESDKEFAKREVDKRPQPASLAENPDAYFTRPEGARDVPLTDLISTKTEEENQQGGDNGPKRMEAAARGELAKRAPITVMPSKAKPGKFEVVDGNGTLTSAQNLGWKNLPAVVVDRVTGERAIKIDKAASAAEKYLPKKLVKEAVAEIEKFKDVPDDPAFMAARAEVEAFVRPLLDRAAEVNDEYAGRVRALAKSLDATPSIGPLKKVGRAAYKMWEDSFKQGLPMDESMSKDIVRASIIVGQESDVAAAIAAVQAEFEVIPGRLKDRFKKPMDTGYRDILMNVRLENGTIAELQIHIPEIYAAKELGHLVYEGERQLQEGTPERERLIAFQRRYYGAAYDLALRRITSFAASSPSNSSSVAGAPDSMARENPNGTPVSAYRNLASLAEPTTGTPSTSNNPQPGLAAADFQSNAIDDTSVGPTDEVILRQARAKKSAEPAEQKPPADPAIAERIGKQLRFSAAQLASTSLAFQTGQAKTMAFNTPRVGGIPATIAFLEERRLASGLRPLDLANDADREELANLMTAEALAAINAAGSAVEWYDKTIATTVARMSTRFPELRTSADARAAFLLTVAIMSQGQNVETNLSSAIDMYPQYQATGRFKVEGRGDSEKQMEMNFQLLNEMLDQFGSMGELMRFMRTPFTVGELKAMGYKIGGELVDEQVLGSSVLGPKIGFGFFSNLMGDFEPVTMDMWFMRTIGRLLGRLRSFDAKKFKKQTDRFLESLGEVGGTDALYADAMPQDLVSAALEPVVDEETGQMVTNGDAVAELARSVNSKHQAEYRNRRAEFDAKTRVKSKMVAASATIIQSLDKPKDAPASGGERRMMRDVVRRMVDKVAKAHGTRVPPAALQALIWYPEQELYKSLGVPLSVTSQDYAGAALKTLVAGGATEADAKKFDNDTQTPAAPNPYTAAEKAELIQRRVEEGILRNERADPKRTRLFFEVAPDPNDAELSNRWRALSQDDRREISARVMRQIVAKVLEANDNSAVIVSQVGSFLDDTNPSFGLLLKKSGSALAIAKELGFALSQNSMALLSPKPFKGSFESGAVVIDIGERSEVEIDGIYQTLRGLRLSDGNQITGQSTSGGRMTVMVPMADLKSFADAADRALGGAYTVSDAAVFAAFPEKVEYDYGSQDDDPRGNGGLARQRARSLRAEAAGLLAAELGPAPKQARAAAARAGPAQEGLTRGAASAQYANLGDPLSGDYKPLEGRKLSLNVLIEDTGQKATFTVDAAQHLRSLDARLDVARRLAGCVGR